MSKTTQISSFEAFRALENRAIELAHQEGKELAAAVNTMVKAKEDWEGGPISVMFAMRDTYGMEVMTSLPKPGVDYGNNPAIIKTQSKGANNKTVTKTVDFWIVFPDNTKEGQRLSEELAWLRLLSDKEADHSKIPDAFKKAYFSPQKRNEYESTLKRKRNTIRIAYRKAGALFHQMAAINELPHVECDFIYTDVEQTQVINNAAPIRIEDPRDPRTMYDDYSVATVLKMDVAKAQENGGTLEALNETLKREGKSGQGGEEGTELIRTPSKFESVISDLHESLDFAVSDAKQELFGALVAYMNKKTGDQLVANVVDVRNMLNEVLAKVHKVGERHQRVTEANNKIAEQIEGKQSEAA